MKINLFIFDINDVYFEVSVKHNHAYTSSSIADLFNLDINEYHDLLIKKVIKHSNYIIDDRYDKDLSFSLDDVSKETYIERFKDTFTKELILLILDENLN